MTKARKTKADSKKKKTAKRDTKMSKTDLIQLILRDHKPLWKMIKVMKSEKASFSEKKSTFEDFAPALTAHAKPEEQTWYEALKSEHDMNIEGIEGDTEHALADQLCEELKETKDEDIFMAKVKVLAELVEHHLEEEEEDLLPQYKKDSSSEEREELGQKYLELQAEYE